jgi:hypothetical protein
MVLSFQLQDLGWYGFEQLCRTICREVYRQPVESFSRGADGGRDGYFIGPWTTGGSSISSVIQCKHTTKATRALTLAILEPELPKIKHHVEGGQCDRYVLMTNMKISGDAAADMHAALRGVGVVISVIHGYESICELVSEHKTLRAQVPRLYGLGDLTEILDERSYAQAEAVLATMHDDLARLVPVEAHRKAHAALRDERFALLIGRPGSGKTSIAASLAIGAIDIYGTRTIKLAHPIEIKEHWNPNDPDQLFWIDDAFGATQYDSHASTEWNLVYPFVAAALARGARVILTSRDYIYEAARPDLKVGAFPLLDEAKIVIEVESFSKGEREQILYNHLRLGRQAKDFLSQLKPAWLEEFASHPHFLPEIARRLGDPLFTRSISSVRQEALLDFVDRPKDLLLEILVSLDAGSRAALGLVHLRGGRLPSPYVEVPGDKDLLDRVGAPLSLALSALSALNGSLLRLVAVGGDRWWQFHHPTFTDAYRSWLSEQPEMLGQYIDSTPFEELVRSVTCGDMGITGALVVPSSLNGRIGVRIAARPDPPVWSLIRNWKSMIWSFLERRCDEVFLREFLVRNPDIIDDTFSIGLFLQTHFAERSLAKRLLDLGVATDAHRRHLVEQLTEYGVSGQDGSFLTDDDWLYFFSVDELRNLDNRIREETVPVLDDLIYEELLVAGRGEAPIYELQQSIDCYEARYGVEGDEVYDRAREHVEEYVAQNPERDDEWYEESRSSSQRDQVDDGTRSIFDDLAE